MKAYNVYHGNIEVGISVTFKDNRIIIWENTRRPIEITAEGWNGDRLSKIEDVEVIQRPEGYAIAPCVNSGLTAGESNRALVLWSFTSPEDGDAKIFGDILEKYQNIVLGKSSYRYDGMMIAGILAVLPPESHLSAEITDRYSKTTIWGLFWNGQRIAVVNSRKNIFGAFWRTLNRVFGA